MDFSNLPPMKPEMEEEHKNKEERKKISPFVQIIAVSIVCGLIAGGLAGFFVYAQLKEYVGNLKMNYPFISDSTSGGQIGQYIPQTAQEESIIRAVKEASPAVVSILISKNVPTLENNSYLFNPFNDFNDLFGSPFQFRIEVPQKNNDSLEKREVGGGTGVIISKDGIILTNKHVVIDTEAEYTIFTNDGKKYQAKVLARDPVQDLAILKIDQTKSEEKTDSFPVAKLGNSDNIEIGQTAIAIGNALGEYKNTISVGVISGLGRTITASGGGNFAETLEGIIQTDAAINEGNSGGPLLNLRGEVIGVNTAMVLQAQSIGFAIPVNKAKRDIEQIKTLGKIVYPFLGVRYVLVNEAIKEEKKLAVDYGALIAKGEKDEQAVLKGSAADKAGVKEGDIILEINGEKISAANSLASIISKFNPKDTIKIKLLRDGKEMDASITLDERTE